jgi:DUF1680 family protein
MQGKKPYNGTLDGHCCLSSGPRGVSLIPTFALSTDADGVVVNLYDAGAATLQLRDGTSVAVTTQTQYPGEDRIRIILAPEAQKAFALKLRIPAWCPRPDLRVNARKVTVERGLDGYVALRREWKKGDRVQLRFKLEPRVLVGDHKNEGRLAVLYGPLVLAADEALLGDKQCPLTALGVASATLAALQVTPKPAPDKLKSWPGAQVFRINAFLLVTAGG